MRGEIIALDIESTGLDLQVDEMIEIGLARCQGDEIIETYQTLIRPNGVIPDTVTVLTGITNEDVSTAPLFEDVEVNIREFIGQRPILAHNLDFDLKILRLYGLAEDVVALDTLEMASLLMPEAPRYNLGSLAEQLELETADDHRAHRALDDAIVCWRVYRKLYAKLMDVPLEILTELLQLGAGMDWPVLPVIKDVVAIRQQEGERAPEPFDANLALSQVQAQENDVPPPQGTPPTHFDIDAAAAMLGPDGPLAQHLPHYQHRIPQEDMLRAVSTMFEYQRHLVLEAPTGTGKSLAYLIPAAMWSMVHNKRVVISTYTLNLQDQLLQKDIPDLAEHLTWPLLASALKGRNNYLCPRRLHTLRRRRPTSADELRLLGKVLIWLSEGGNGEKHQINLRYPNESSVWVRLSAEDEECSVNQCQASMQGLCPFHSAHKKAENAHLLVVNHALLLSDMASPKHVIPEYDYLVVDEAHHLEHATTHSLSKQFDRFSIRRRLQDIGGVESGLLGDMLNILQKAVPEGYYIKLHNFVSLMENAAQDTERNIRIFFKDLMRVLDDGSQTYVDYNTDIIVRPEVRRRREWAEVVSDWNQLSTYTDGMVMAMAKIYNGVNTLITRYEDNIKQPDVLLSSLESAQEYLRGLHMFFDEFIQNPQLNTIYWAHLIHKTTSDHIILRSAPLHVGTLMNDYLWEKKKAILMTSATLRSNNTFDYIDDRLSAYDIDHAVVESPFDYRNSTLVYLPNDIEEPKQRAEYQSALEQGIIEVASVTQGRMLVLFTSRQHLHQTAQAVEPALAKQGIAVYDQASGSSRQLLLDNFKETEKAVLMGTRSFWEGVDIPGDDLSVVFITKLPFAVPSDPVFASRADTYGDQSFMEYNMPDAILRFRQGFGRLIRRNTDRGVVVIFDKRIISKRYGKLFVDSLPDVTLQRGPLNRLPHATRDWLNDAP